MREFGTCLIIAVAATIAIPWHNAAASVCTTVITSTDLLLFEGVVLNGQPAPRTYVPEGHSHGSFVVQSSPSGTFQQEWIPSEESPRQVDLYAGDRYVSSYSLPWDRPRLQYLLDDGTYVAFENWSCTESGITRTIIALSSSGLPLWQTDIESLLPEEFAEQLTPPSPFDRERSWILTMDSVELEGTDTDDAKLIARLSNYDQLEITLADGTSRYIRVDDLGDDANAWYARGEWYEFRRNDTSALQHFRKILEIDPHHRPAIHGALQIHERQDRDDLIEAHLRESIADNPVSDLGPAETHSLNMNLGSTQGHPVHLQLRLAELLVQNDRPDAALAALNATLAHIPYEWQTRVARANLLMNDSNRGEIRQEMTEVLDFHLAAVASSSEREVDKAVVTASYREAYADWIEHHEFNSLSSAENQ